MAVRLTDLEPEFIRYDGTSVPKALDFNNAQGIWFLCPLCFQKNNGPIGTHMVEVSFEGRGVLPEQGSHNDEGQPSRWNVSGTGYSDLTLSPSVWLKGEGCGWHGHVHNGEVS